MAIEVQGTTVIDDSRNLQNSINLNATGNVYANTFIGDGSQITNVPASGGTVTATVSGNLSDGSMVVVNSDSTVSKVELIEKAVSIISEGLSPGYKIYTRAAYDTANDKLVIVYNEPSSGGSSSAVVASIGSSGITFGTPVTFAASNSNYPDIVYDSNSQKLVVVWNEGTSTGRSSVGTVSGTDITFGSTTTFKSGSSGDVRFQGIGYDPSNQKVVVAFRSSSGRGQAMVGAVSGTSVSWGSEYQFTTDYFSYQCRLAYDSNAQKMVINYADSSSGIQAAAVVATVSGYTLSFGSTNFYQTSAAPLAITYDTSAGKIVSIYKQTAGGQNGYAVVGTVSGTSISFGTPVLFHGGTTSWASATYFPDSQEVVIGHALDTSSDIASFIAGKVSGTTISLGSALTIPTYQNTATHAAAYDPDTKSVVQVFYTSAASHQLAAVALGQGTTLSSTNFLGISNDAYANNSTATIQISGALDDAQTGLAPGKTHYVLANGSISTTAAIPSVVAGVAITSTKLLVKG